MAAMKYTGMDTSAESMALNSNDISKLLFDGNSEFLGLEPMENDVVQQLILQTQQQQQQQQPQQSFPGSPIASTSRETPKPAKQSTGKTMPTQKTPDGIYVEIMEQPKQRGLRFRYECEGRSAGSIPGENSTTEKKTFPTIKIHNYSGTAVIVVSCVTKDYPHEPHPHNLVGRDCKRGVCTLKVKDTNTISFPHLGIQCAKKKDVENNLKQRKEINVDPFQSGFKHMNKINSIDLNVVRLCFQVFLPDEYGKITRIVPPVVSHCIHDKKSLNELVICRVDRSSGKAKGGDEVFLLCEKINRDDIVVRFYEETEYGDTLWEDFGDFSTNDIHRQYAIVFRTPPYKDTLITRPKEVKMQLKRVNEPETSESIPFIYMPEDPDPDRIMEKRKRKADQLRTWGFNLDEQVQPEDIKQRLKIKATKSRIKQEVPQEMPAIPTYSMNNIMGTTNPPNPPSAASMGTSTTMAKDGSLNVRTLDNTTMGNVTITPTDSVRQQLAALPDDVQTRLLQTLALQKLQEEARHRLNPGNQETDINAFVAALTGGSQAPQNTNPSGNTLQTNMPQASGDLNASAVDLNMLHTYLGDQDQNVSFDSFGSLQGNMMNLDYDPNVGAMVSVSSDGGNQGQVDETRAAIQSLNNQS